MSQYPAHITKNLKSSYQTNLFGETVLEEVPGYLTDQLITYIGNKRSLIPEIEAVVFRIKEKLGKDRIRILDAFSGSGVVARYFKRHAQYLATIDLEDYAAVVSRCYLKNKNAVNQRELALIIADLNSRVDSEEFAPGFIEELYAPRSEHNITKDDRVFYTKQNARRIDNYRRMINEVSCEYRDLILGPLLSEASVHANTSGVFKGFHKDRRTRIGKYGGTNADALKRILGEIRLQPPILSRFECEVDVFHGDANGIAPQIRDLDLTYLDPPYNQHPYGSNYFMLNLIVTYERPTDVSNVSGIPVNWKRSRFNVRSNSLTSFRDLIESLDTRFVLVSFNDEGFISPGEMMCILNRLGSVEVIEIKYNTFRGCRNIRNRSVHVTEQMFLVERK
ncbi:MAG TPA: DNA adenine methylase [bacterium]|nr:DNA adenine methylase [bacterium]HQL64063.1 DNA adenine methylase [bacterium]